MSRILLALLIVLLIAPGALAQDPDAPADQAAPAPQESADAAAQAGEAAADEPPPPSAEAVAANEAFEMLIDQWNVLIGQLDELKKKRDAAEGEERTGLESQMNEVRKQTSDLVDKISAAGLTVYRIDASAFPRVNATLLAIAQFHVIGDPQGDGGDQYERALPLVKGLIDAGAAESFPALYLLGGMSAYCLNDFDVAEEYFTKANAVGLFANVPEPTGREAPRTKLLIDSYQYSQNLAAQRKNWADEQKVRAAEADADDLPRVKLTTTKGDIVLELFENEAPQAVANFLTLAKQGFYDNAPFHRVLPLFMAQGGDPEGTGEGGPGYTIRDEYRAPKARKHFRGSLAMARTQAPNSSGSQFYIAFVPTSMLDGGYTVFGRALEGVEIAAALRRRDPQSAGPKPTPDKIIKAEVLRDRGHAYEFEKLAE
jgi:cyclophilin family peptidyl-prolyl cis-trans isomerase